MGHHGSGGTQFSDFGHHGLMLDLKVYIRIVLSILSASSFCGEEQFLLSAAYIYDESQEAAFCHSGL